MKFLGGLVLTEKLGFQIGNLSRSLLRHSALAIATRYAAVLCVFVLNALFARFLSQNEYGVFLLMVAGVTVFELVITLGLGEYVVKTLPGLRANNDSPMAMGVLRMIATTVTVAILITILLGRINIGGPFLARLTGEPLLIDLFPITMVLLSLWGLNSLVGQVLLGLGCGYASPVIYYLLPRVISLIALGVTCYLSVGLEVGTAIRIFSIGCGVSFVCGLIRIFFVVKDFSRSSSPPHLRSMLSVSLPLMLSRLLQIATPCVTWWIIAVFATTDDVARFGATHRLLEGFTTAFAVATFVFRPTIALLASQQRTDELSAMCRSVATLIMLPNLVLVAVAFITGAEVMSLVYGTPYANCGNLFAIMSVGYCVQAATGPAIEVLRLSGHHAITLRVQMIMSAVLLIGQVVALQWFSVISVAILLCGYYAVTSLIFATLAYQRVKATTICTFSPQTFSRALSIN